MKAAALADQFSHTFGNVRGFHVVVSVRTAHRGTHLLHRHLIAFLIFGCVRKINKI